MPSPQRCPWPPRTCPPRCPATARRLRGALRGQHRTNGIIWQDRWAADNHNSVVLARSGAGKSYFIKLEILRSLYDGVQVNVIDPEDEYLRLAEAVGGIVIQLGAPGVRLNPLDIAAGDNRPDALQPAGAVHAHTGQRSTRRQRPRRRDGTHRAAALDRASPPRTCRRDHQRPEHLARPAPLLRDVAAALEAHATRAGAHPRRPALTLDDRIFRDLFDGPTTTGPAGQLVVWSTRQLADELRAPGMLLALDAIWREVDAPPPTARPPTHAASSSSTRPGPCCATAKASDSCSGWRRPPANGGPGCPWSHRTPLTCWAPNSARPSSRTPPPRS